MMKWMIRLVAMVLVLAPAQAWAQLGSIPYPAISGTVISSSQYNANLSVIFSNALNLTGGQMSGTLTTLDIVPVTTASYDLGTSSVKYRDFYFSRNGLIGGTLGVTGAGTFSSTVAITGALSLTAGMALDGGTASTHGIVMPSAVPGTTTNALYNNGGVLTFNGTAIPFGTGTSGKIAKFTGTGTLGDSIMSESSTTVALAGSLQLSANSVQPTGSIGKNATDGMEVVPVTGATNDFQITNAAGTQSVLRVPTGTNNAIFAGVITATSPALTTPALTGTITGTYTLGGTPTIPASGLTGTITSATQDLITRTGTLVSGATGAGFTVALTTSTVSGTLPCANHPALTGNVTTSAGNCATTIAATAVTNAMLAGSIAASKLIGSDIATVGTITTGTWNAGGVASTNGLTTTLATDSSSSATGSIITAGGAGIAKSLFVGSSTGAASTPYTNLNGLRISGGDSTNTIYQGNVTNMGLNVQTGYMSFATNGVETMRLSAAGGLSIGTTTDSGAGRLSVALGAVGTPSHTFNGDLNTGMWSPGADVIAFSTGGAERMRMFASGGVDILGTTDPTAGFFAVGAGVGNAVDSFWVAPGSTSILAGFGSSTTGSSQRIQFTNSNGVVGSIVTNGSGTAFNTTSDQRLKDDLGVATSTRLGDLIIHDFTWKVDGSAGRGVFAQEAAKVYPDAVFVGDSRTKVEGNKTTLKNPWAVDYSKFIPDLIVGWQGHDHRIEDLEQRVKALESR